VRTATIVGFASTMIFIAQPLAWAGAVKPTNAAASIVQAQVEAFNKGDAEAFASLYADEVELFDLGPNNKPSLVGRAALIARYKPMFIKYRPHAIVLSRMESGDFVIDKERTEAGGRSSEGVAIYQIESSKIRRVWFTP
jgi:hypothetical protein